MKKKKKNTNFKTIPNNQDGYRAVMEMLVEHWPGTFICLLNGPWEPGICNYISNGSRPDIIKALRETADRLEKNQDNSRKLT